MQGILVEAKQHFIFRWGGTLFVDFVSVNMIENKLILFSFTPSSNYS